MSKNKSLEDSPPMKITHEQDALYVNSITDLFYGHHIITDENYLVVYAASVAAIQFMLNFESFFPSIGLEPELMDKWCAHFAEIGIKAINYKDKEYGK